MWCLIVYGYSNRYGVCNVVVIVRSKAVVVRHNRLARHVQVKKKKKKHFIYEPNPTYS